MNESPKGWKSSEVIQRAEWRDIRRLGRPDARKVEDPETCRVLERLKNQTQLRRGNQESCWGRCGVQSGSRKKLERGNYLSALVSFIDWGRSSILRYRVWAAEMCHVKVWPEQCEKHGVEHDKGSYFYRSELHYGRHMTVTDLADCRTCIFFSSLAIWQR